LLDVVALREKNRRNIAQRRRDAEEDPRTNKCLKALRSCSQRLSASAGEKDFDFHVTHSPTPFSAGDSVVRIEE
jgi:hypothetical protein